MRENYDYLLDHPYEFPGHFMRFSRASYMPKSDLRFVMLLTVLILSAMQFYFLKSRYEIQIKEIKRSSQYQVSSPAPRANLRRHPLPCYSPFACSLTVPHHATPPHQAELKKLMESGIKKSSGGSAKGKGIKGDKAEEAKAAAEATLLEEIANECKEPQYQDTLAWKLFVLPLDFYYNGQVRPTLVRVRLRGEVLPTASSPDSCELTSPASPPLTPPFPYYNGQANLSWFLRYTLLRGEYDAEAKAYLTCKALGMDAAEWQSFSEAEQAQLNDLALWDKVSTLVRQYVSTSVAQ